MCDAALKRGQPAFRVHIFPFRMTAEAIKAESGNANSDFWENLKAGFDRFEKAGVPPEVSVVAGKYTFQR